MADRPEFLAQHVMTALAELQRHQVEVDADTWTSSTDPIEKRLHIALHVTIAAGKLARIEERAAHGDVADPTVEDVSADLLIYALQLATIQQANLGDLYSDRIRASRTGSIKHRAGP